MGGVAVGLVEEDKVEVAVVVHLGAAELAHGDDGHFARLAGATLPDRAIDGKDIWPLLSGKPGAKSPHEAFYYYQMDQLQAVRSGKWKLFVEMESKKRNWGKPEGKTPMKLFDLSTDIHEDNDVKDQHPEVVKRLLALAEKAREDLGDVNRAGKGQRPAGWVDKPEPRLLKKD